MAEIQKELYAIQRNWKQCADCDETDIEWAEITRGILLCKECAGDHRSMGSHISKVKSVQYDTWQPKWVENMEESDAVFNAIWEYHVPALYVKPNKYSSDDVRKSYIMAKYIGVHYGQDLNPAFHKEGPNGSRKALPPVYDTAESNVEMQIQATATNASYYGTIAIMFQQLCT